MKRMIRSVPEASGAEYQLWMELAPTQSPGAEFFLKFSSIWTGAKDPSAEQAKGEFFLDREDINRMREMIQEVVR